MSTVVIIPARYGSTRFPGKPLAQIKGRSMLERVWSLARSARGVDEVVIATDDARISAHAAAFGARSVITPQECRNGTERAFEAAKLLERRPDVVINLQGDAVLTPPWIVEALAERMAASGDHEMATPAVAMSRPQYEELKMSKAKQASGGTLVTFDLRQRALYFSKALIPFLRDPAGAGERPPIHRHVGMYAYRFDVLERYVSLGESPLERAEGLEQLRALENGISIQVVLVDYRGRTHWSVDTPDDLAKVEAIIEREGEL